MMDRRVVVRVLATVLRVQNRSGRRSMQNGAAAVAGVAENLSWRTPDAFGRLGRRFQIAFRLANVLLIDGAQIAADFPNARNDSRLFLLVRWINDDGVLRGR